MTNDTAAFGRFRSLLEVAAEPMVVASRRIGYAPLTRLCVDLPGLQQIATAHARPICRWQPVIKIVAPARQVAEALVRYDDAR